ncbi:MAG TPA: cytochrome c [Candidatus Udaeobacter sp.]|jgi:thiosulfate dehydrogenase|nr:cytochrome c [Candidatus Udaeobacter sp.]
MFKGILLGIILGFILIGVGAYFYFASGQVPVTTNSPEMPFERKMAKLALHAYLGKVPHANPPVAADEANLLAGAKIYKEDCAVCHGLPGEPHNAIGNGMFPKPPLLFRGVGVTDDETWESYTKVSGGIRMTGMPGFKDRLSDTQLWQVSVLVKNADKLPASVKAELAPPPGTVPVAAGSSTKADSDHDHDHVH